MVGRWAGLRLARLRRRQGERQGLGNGKSRDAVPGRRTWLRNGGKGSHTGSRWRRRTARQGDREGAHRGRRTTLDMGVSVRAGEEDARTLRGARGGEGKLGAARRSGATQGCREGASRGREVGEGERRERTHLEPPCARTLASALSGSREGDKRLCDDGVGI